MNEKNIRLVNLGQLIRAKRISLDWSQERLAIEIKRCRRTVSTIESGSSHICPRTVAQLDRIWPDVIKCATTLA